MDFGQALIELKNGNKVKRKGWNGDGIFLVLQVPDKNSKMTQPYIYIDTLGLKTNNPNGLYWEVTHNGDKNETYVDTYTKSSNLCIKGE